MASNFPMKMLSNRHTKLSFFEESSSTPVSLVKPMGQGLDDYSGQYKKHKVLVHDGRKKADNFTLDTEGFAFMREESGVVDFYDDETVKKKYYPEMEQLLKEVTGAHKVLIFDHTRRIDDPSSLERLGARPPAAFVHNDFTVDSAIQRVIDLLPETEAANALEKRFASINVWRPLKEPVETSQLAICEYRTIDNRDLVVSERHYSNNRIGKIYNLKYNPNQKWYFFPQMRCDEIILLKCFDSLTDGTARWTAHGSFQNPNSKPGSAPRESIEVRSMVFFD